MITFLKGIIEELTHSYLIINISNVGYKVNISLQTYEKLRHKKECKIYTHLSIKEDSHTLWGFFEEKERELFRLLINISGIGTNTARMILSSMTSNELKNAIMEGNIAIISKVKGIGKKTAQRLIVELQDKMKKEKPLIAHNHNTMGVTEVEINQTIAALTTLGLKKEIAQKKISQILEKQKDKKFSAEELIKLVLKG